MVKNPNWQEADHWQKASRIDEDHDQNDNKQNVIDDVEENCEGDKR